ncbi:Ankyrin repeat protein 3 [Giardia muris]|uniref:Ankyrin repeat protein 3 n=1 Tax=Giardia muris TaxID=5742 RepID=A0A4Z1T2D6_GIAMU|nr:Ankyrin repeat protein 3 [Giardia muris]|eukprot:TNJ27197.1 Ankyrin repeat protein 3 [Giardia muris]
MSKVKTVEQWFEAAIEGNLAAVKGVAKKFKGSLNEDGYTALMLAVMNSRHSLLPVLAPLEAHLKDSEGMTALLHAVQEEDAEACTVLVGHEAKDTLEDGRDALMVAAELGSSALIPALLPHFSLVKDKNDMTAVDYAATAGNEECIRMLLAHYNPNPEMLEIALGISQNAGNDDVTNAIVEHITTYEPREEPQDNADVVSQKTGKSGASKKTAKSKTKEPKPPKEPKAKKGKGDAPVQLEEDRDPDYPRIDTPAERPSDYEDILVDDEARPVLYAKSRAATGVTDTPVEYVVRTPTPVFTDYDIDLVEGNPGVAAHAVTAQPSTTGQRATAPAKPKPAAPTTNLKLDDLEPRETMASLRARIAELEAENERLQRENDYLRANVKGSGAGTGPMPSGIEYPSSPSKKITKADFEALFKRLDKTNNDLRSTIKQSEVTQESLRRSRANSATIASNRPSGMRSPGLPALSEDGDVSDSRGRQLHY